jgi:tetratricopeptide (TPR) repeat protein
VIHLKFCRLPKWQIRPARVLQAPSCDSHSQKSNVTEDADQTILFFSCLLHSFFQEESPKLAKHKRRRRFLLSVRLTDTISVMPSKIRGGASRPRVTINESKASIYTSLQLTDSLQDKQDSSCTSVGSGASGNSFAFRIDWSDGDFENTFEDKDPDLLRMPKTREGRRQVHNGDDDERLNLSREVSHQQEEYRSNAVSLAINGGPSSFSIHEQSYDDIAPDLVALHSSEEDTSGGGSTPSRQLSSPSSSIRRVAMNKQFPASLSIPAASSQDRFDAASLVSELSPPRPRQQPRINLDPTLRKAQEKRMYWMKRAASCLAECGIDNLETADAYMELGLAELQIGDYAAAKSSFELAYCTFRRFRKHVAVAKALDCLGVTNSRCGAAYLAKALELLQEAFQIRRQELGVWHVDTVDTMNRIAKVHALANNFPEARRCYWEVFWVRKGIFGAQHPGVAVAAHDLANAFVKLGSLEDGSNFYQIAMEIFDRMELPSGNPAVSKLLRDMKQLEETDRYAEI